MKKLEYSVDNGWFKQLFELSPDPAWIIDGREFVECNEAAVRILGYASRDDLLKVHPSKISPCKQPNGEDSFEMAERMLDIANLKNVNRFDWVHTKADGSDFVAEVTLSKIDLENRHILYCVWRDVTERKKSEEALKESEFRWKFAIEGSGDGVWDWNIETDEVKYSKRWKEMLGYSEDDILPTNDEWVVRIHPLDQPYVAGAMQAYLEGKTEIYIVEYRLRCKDESYKWILGRGMVVSRGFDGVPLRMIGTHTDITQRKHAEESLRESEERFRLGFENANIGMCLVDLSGSIFRVNGQMCEMFGYDKTEMERMKVDDIAHPDSMRESRTFMQKAEVEGLNNSIFEKKYFHKSGRVVIGQVSSSLVRNAEGDPLYFISHVSDITERKEMEDQVRQLAFFDPLTNLPNRRLFYDRLRQAMAVSKRSDSYGALMFLDLDNFKPVNDKYGHLVGDVLLIEAANRLRKCVREVDTVARIGGDEFVVVLSYLDSNKSMSLTEAGVVAEKVKSSLSEPYVLHIGDCAKEKEVVQHVCTVSVGVVVFISRDESLDEIVRRADSAMYEAKNAGRNMIRIYQ